MTHSGGQAATSHPVWDALLAFQERPGTFVLGARQPAVLFDNTLAVLALAADRTVGLQGNESVPHAVQEAARFFVRRVMLRADGDHYTVLGTKPDADAATLKEHYRLMMRLTHPDRQSAGELWPPDAASRVNLAYQVLGSAVERATYDAHRSAPLVQGSNGGGGLQRRKVAVRARTPAAWSRPRERRWGVWVAGGVASAALVTIAVWLGQASHDDSMLVAGPVTSMAPKKGGAVPEPLEAPTAFAVDDMQGMAAVVPADDEAGEQTGYELAVVSSLENTPSVDVVREPLPWAGVAKEVTVDVAKAPTASLAPERGSARRPADKLSYTLTLPTARVNDATPIANAKAPPPATVETQGLPVSPIKQPALPVVATPKEASEEPTPPAASYDMRMMQPALTELVEALGGGKPEQVRRWAVARALPNAEAVRFAQAFERAMEGATVLGVGRSEFQLSVAYGEPVVNGALQMRVASPGPQGSSLKAFNVRAQFRIQGAAPVLVDLEAR